VDKARGDDNKAISGLSEGLSVGGFERAYILFGVKGCDGEYI
jgi:hypothetical protein